MDIEYKNTYEFGDSDDLVIWRYLTIEKFRDLLETRSLYLCRMDKFIDEYEGYMNIFTSKILDDMFVDEFSNHEEMAKSLKNALTYSKEFAFVNCWHIADKESECMWVNYTDSTSGVVIKTTAKRLMASISQTDAGSLHVRKVEYLNTIDNDVNLLSMLRLLSVKQEKYQHEKELRLILFYSKGDVGKDGEIILMNKPEKGLKLAVDLNILIDELYIHPKATETDYVLLREIVLKLIGKSLRKSLINNLPVI